MNNDDQMTMILDKLSSLDLINGKIDNLATEMSGVRTEVTGLKSDIGELKVGFEKLNADVNILKDDVSGLKTDVSELKSDVSELKFSVRRLEVLHEETSDNIKLILETVVPNSKQVVELRDRNEIQDEKLQFHERRIGFLEKKVA